MKYIYAQTPNILDVFGGFPNKVKEIKISNTMRKTFLASQTTVGCWDESLSSIIIARNQLKKTRNLCGHFNSRINSC
jgi:hypothetical protein